MKRFTVSKNEWWSLSAPIVLGHYYLIQYLWIQMYQSDEVNTWEHIGINRIDARFGKSMSSVLNRRELPFHMFHLEDT